MKALILKILGVVVLSAAAATTLFWVGTYSQVSREEEKMVPYVDVKNKDDCQFTKSVVNGIEVTKKPCQVGWQKHNSASMVLPGSVISNTDATGEELKRMKWYSSTYEDYPEE